MASYQRLDASITEDPLRKYRRFKRSPLTPAESDKAEPQAETYKHRRKSTPTNMLLPRTSKWGDELSPRVRPVVLMRQFPRIANLIAGAWDDLVQFETYMDSLLTDKRGGRKGFPPEVIAELGALDIYRHTVRECAISAIAWSDVAKRG